MYFPHIVECEENLTYWMRGGACLDRLLILQGLHYEVLSGPAQKQNDNNLKNTEGFSVKRKHNGNGGHFGECTNLTFVYQKIYMTSYL